MDNNYLYEMKRCKMDWLDDIFLATKDSQGIRNATNAIKFVLFDDYSMIPDGLVIDDKYEFISSKRDARAKAKLLQEIDLIQILAKFAMQSFGIKRKAYEIDYSEYLDFRRTKIANQGFTDEFIIELVSYAFMDSVYGGYIFLSSHKFLRDSLLNSLIDERYLQNKIDELDSFNGIVEYDGVTDEIRQNYLDSFIHLDEDFLNIKKRDNSYIDYISSNDSD